LAKKSPAVTEQPKVYFWAPGHQRAIDSQVLGDTIDGIAAKKGVCHPQDLVDAARSRRSPLHSLFEWDDEVAAELFRRGQARQVIRILRPMMDDETRGEAPAFVHVRINGHDGYLHTDRARSQEDVWASVLEDALAQLQGLQKRYKHLSELEGVWAAVTAVEKKAKVAAGAKKGKSK